MKRLLMLVLTLLLAGGFHSGDARAASEADLKGVVATLEEGYRLLRDLQADFTQRTTIAAFKREERGSGELYLKRPASGAAMFSFDYKKPRQQIVSDGKQVWFYIPENRQVMVSSAKAVLAQGGVALNYLTGLGNVSRDFTVRFVGSGRDMKGNYLVELIPKKGGQAFVKLQLTIAAKAVESYRANGSANDPFPILASVVFDQMGNRTTIEYGRVKANRGIGSGRFTFKIPPGVDIIKQ